MAVFIMDSETGETKYVPEGTKIKLVTPSTIEYLQTLSEYQKTGEQRLYEKGFVPFKPSKNHVKVFTKEFKLISEELSGGGVALLMLLMPYARMGSNILFTLNEKYKVDRNYIMANISPFGRNKTLDIINELKRLVVIVEASDMGNTKQYVINPYIYFKGKYINKTILGLFNKYKKRG